MLDLESLFATQSAGAYVPNCANATITAENLAPWGIEPDQPHPDRGEVGHSGHNGNTPVLGQVCPRKPLQHKAFDGLGTVGTLGTVEN